VQKATVDFTALLNSTIFWLISSVLDWTPR
jgi:hypothetical protein